MERGREGAAGNGGRLETAALCPGELNWMGTCWGSRYGLGWDLGLGTGSGTGES